jgi:hypothetical protein
VDFPNVSSGVKTGSSPYQESSATVRRLMADVLPYTWGAFAVAAATGEMMFSSNAAKRSADFRVLIGQLLERCNACHALHLKTD